MADLTVSFGNGGLATMSALTNADPNYVGDQLALNGGRVETVSPDVGSGEAIIPETVSVGAVGTRGSGTGGSVGIDFLDDGSFSFDVAGRWNSVKNALAQSDGNGSVTLKDFVHVDVAMGNGGDSYVDIENAKRGNVVTGDGNDTVHVSLLTNDRGWSNIFNVFTGDGDDSINLTQGNASAAAAKANSTVDGHFTTLTIDAGDGNDTIDLSAVRLRVSNITGGAGHDTITASRGADIFHYNVVDGGNGSDDIFGFSAAQGDRFSLTGLTVTDHITFQGNTIVALSDGSDITMHGVATYDAGWFA